MGYLKDTLKGLSWMGSYRVVNRLVVFLKTALLARLLTPTQFGVFGIATLALAFLEVFTETGINTVLIQLKKNMEDYIDTAWIISILRGLLMGLILFLCAPLIALFFSSPQSRGVIMLMSLIPVIRGFLNPSIVRLQKDLHFGKEFTLKTLILVADALTAIVLTLVTKSVYSLIWGMIFGALVELVFSWVVIKPRPKLVFDKDKLSEIFGKGKWVTLSGIFHYLFQNGDNIVIGRLLGEASLGIYSMAYKISSLPISEVSDVFIKVTFPIYVKISEDLYRLKRAFIRSTVLSGILVLVLGVVVFVFPETIVTVILGKEWLIAVPVLKILAIFGVIKGILTPSYALFLAVGKQNYVTYITLLGMLGLGLSIIPLTNRYGIIGTGYSVIIGSVVIMPLIFYFVLKILGGKK